MTLSPKDIGLCSVFAVALPLGQVLFKWGAVYDKQLAGPFLVRVVQNYPLIGAFAWYALELRRTMERTAAVRLFHYSLLYLALLFVAMAVDAVL